MLELSSFQTESLAEAKPVDIAVITNLLRDHLNAYPSMEEYAEAKAQLFRHQTPKQIVLLNQDDAYGKKWMQEAPSRVISFGEQAHLPIPEKDFPLLGAHNATHAHTAILVAQELGVPRLEIKKRLKTFKPLPHRLELVRVWRNIRFVNDTTATTPDGTIAAIKTLQEGHHHLWVIAGGADEALEYAQLATLMKKVHPHVHLLLLPGDASEKMKKALFHVKEHIHTVPDLREAVEQARRFAVPGDTVVLSPGAASFNQFANEFERGDEFIKWVKRIKR